MRLPARVDAFFPGVAVHVDHVEFSEASFPQFSSHVRLNPAPHGPMPDPETVVSISALNRLARQTLEKTFPLMWICGEVSNLTRAGSGHLYFTLKDDAAQARCVMFRSRAQMVPWRLENGQQVEARALVSLYEARGDFQLNVEGMRQAGLGKLFEAFARLKDKLQAEGLFAPERKQLLPPFPKRIGIISSPAAAALHDVLVALKRRAAHVAVTLYPTPVQGTGAGNSIAEALQLAQRDASCDLLLLVRGGGSIEDLWAFNEEVVARAIAASTLPIISGVGHETDTTIADFVADLRAATPTAAAEIATQHWVEASEQLQNLGASLARQLQRQLGDLQQRLDHLGLRLLHPSTRLKRMADRLDLLGWRLAATVTSNVRQHRQQLDRCRTRLERSMPRTEARRGQLAMLAQRLRTAIQHQHEQRKHTLQALRAALQHLNPQATLDRGFAIVRNQDGQVVTDAGQTKCGQRLQLQLAHGEVLADVADAIAGKAPFNPSR